MQHLDEGTIHAWLDGQLPREEAQSVEAHVAECRQCADAVAEARGLIAASSRILTALDSVPGEVVPTPATFREADESQGVAPIGSAPSPAAGPASAAQRAQRRWFSGPSLAAAAVIVIAFGTVTVMRQSRKSLAPMADVSAPVSAASGPAADSALSAAASATPGRRREAPAAQTEPASSLEGRALEARERLDAPKPLDDARQLAATPPAVPAVTRAKVEQPVIAVPEAPKATDELVKDANRLELRGRAASTVISGTPAANAPVQVQTARPNAAQAQADAAANSAVAPAVRGRVTDANNTGVAGAMVRVSGTNTGVVTSSTGEFALGGLQAGSYRLTIALVGYEPATRDVTVTAGQTVTADVVLRPTSVALSDVVVTGAAAAKRAPAGAAQAKPAGQPAPVAIDTPPGAPISATQSNAVGCYELGITASAPITPNRSRFLQVPRRIALDSEIVPANAGGIWYRARDLARTNAVPDGLWRPSGPDALEIEWTYGSKTARVLVSGLAGAMMRGNVEEIDRATATGDAGAVVAIRRPCDRQ